MAYFVYSKYHTANEGIAHGSFGTRAMAERYAEAVRARYARALGGEHVRIGVVHHARVNGPRQMKLTS